MAEALYQIREEEGIFTSPSEQRILERVINNKEKGDNER